MIEIVEIIWKHHEEAEAAALSLQQVTIEEWTTTTMDVGGASFALVKPVDISLAPSSATTTSTSQRRRRLLVAAGKSHLSYLYVGICSTVLYLDAATTDNSAVLFLHNDDDDDMPIALEIYYHKPARAIDLAWATNKFIEANLESTSLSGNNNNNNNNNNNKISNLPTKIQSRLKQFNSLYRNINNGDRYTLIYLPRMGIRLCLNNVILGTIDFIDMTTLERYDLARILYSVWFGRVAPFSTTMRNELLVPLSRPTKTTLRHFRHAMNASSSSFKMNNNNNIDHQYHHHHRDNIGGLQRALLGIAHDIYYDTMLRGTAIAMIILLGISLWKKMTTTKTKSSSRVIATIYPNNIHDKTK